MDRDTNNQINRYLVNSNNEINSQTLVDLTSYMGPTGPYGLKGETGDPGIKGETGNGGPIGIQGVRGFTGFQGLQGMAGIQGVIRTIDT